MKHPLNQPENVTNIADNVKINNYLRSENKTEIITEIIKGLSADQKTISSRFFYDQKGSQLFKEITALPEYYPTRTEKSILKQLSKDIADHFECSDIVELGSGDCSKISMLLDNFAESEFKKIRYYPVDVSETAILKSARELVNKYSGIRVHGILADFMKHLEALPGEGSKLICFFGSTLGNLESDQAIDFIRLLKGSMKVGDSFLIGLDMVKDIKTLELAYNDNKGITEAFNKNILTVVNSIAGTNFDPVNYKHLAFFNAERSRMEMHLKALRDHAIESPFLSENLFIKKGETLHTENSRKFTHEDIREMATASGLSIEEIHTDRRGWFSLVHFINKG